MSIKQFNLKENMSNHMAQYVFLVNSGVTPYNINLFSDYDTGFRENTHKDITVVFLIHKGTYIGIKTTHSKLSLCSFPREYFQLKSLKKDT